MLNLRRNFAWHVTLLAIASGLAVFAIAQNAFAADHTDPPDRVAVGDAADIGDLYAWHHDDTLTVVLTFAGPIAPEAGQMGTYDRDILYGIHIDTDSDGTADTDIWIRFGQNSEGQWGMQVTNFPGQDSPLVGPVATTNDVPGGGRFYAGLHEDPFFFDLAGFRATFANVQDGDDADDVAFTGADFFGGLNITAIVLDIPLSEVLGNSTSASIWATTAQAGG